MRKLMRTLLTAFTLQVTTYSVMLAQNFWQASGLDTLAVWPLAINSSGHVFVGTGWQIGPPEPWFVFRSTDNGNNWTPLDVPWTDALAINSNGHIFSASASRVFRSTNNGTTWDSVNTGLPNLEVRSLGINPSGYIFAGTNGGGVFRSTNNGDNWTHQGLDSVYVDAFAVSGTALFAGALPGYRDGGVFSSTNNGDTWSRTSLTSPHVGSIVVNSRGHIFAVSHFISGSGIRRSTDAGNSWTPLNAGNTRYVNALAINSSGHIFAGADFGVFLSTDNGDNWEQINSGLPDTALVASLALNSDGYIFAGTAKGIFRSLQSTTSVREIASSGPSTSMLDQNYPNPFNPSTTIRFQIGDLGGQRSEIGLVTLKMYNILGQEVATLVNGRLQARSYEITWDAHGLPSGPYFYRLTTNGLVETKKLVLLR